MGFLLKRLNEGITLSLAFQSPDGNLFYGQNLGIQYSVKKIFKIVFIFFIFLLQFIMNC